MNCSEIIHEICVLWHCIYLVFESGFNISFLNIMGFASQIHWLDAYQIQIKNSLESFSPSKISWRSPSQNKILWATTSTSGKKEHIPRKCTAVIIKLVEMKGGVIDRKNHQDASASRDSSKTNIHIAWGPPILLLCIYVLSILFAFVVY